MPWSKADMPSQSGKVAIVTGSYVGLGYQVVLGLVEAGATVIIAGRSESKGQEALEKLQKTVPNGIVSFSKLDLSSLASVREFSANFNEGNQALDILVNNAGIMRPPKRQLSEDGFEIQFQTNHLGHFALTAQLLPSLRRSTCPRVVNVASIASNGGRINFDDLQSETSYSPMGAYAQSKLANLLFTFELQRRSDEGGWGLLVLAAHPGVSLTDIVYTGPGKNSCFARIARWGFWTIGSSPRNGSLSLLYAATSEGVKPSGYYGPKGFKEIKGKVGEARIPPRAKDLEVARKLWDVSVDLAKVDWT